MLRDVFYYGKKPNVHPREKFAVDINDARSQSTTEHFWIINEFCDYRGFDWDFDFEFLPDEDVWAEEHNNVWPSQHQKDSGTWLCNTDNDTPLTVYRADVDVIKRKNIKTEHWVELDLVDNTKFDFSWHPDPSDPPYIYKWGSKFAPVQLKSCLEYHAPGATQVKYMDQIVELLPTDYWVEFHNIDKDKFDMSWRPDPMDPPMIYVWGNKYVPGETASTLEYHVPGATEKKFMPEKLALLANMTNWELLESVDKNSFDFAWIPDPTSPPYIYAWGNQWNKPEDKISIQYVVEGATEYKYMEERATRKPCMDNHWLIPADVDVNNFDFSWEPSPADPPYVYQFGTQHQRTGGPRYVVEGATEVKYVDTLKAKAIPNNNNWVVPTNIDIAEFDFSWHPDDTDPPYIYVFGTQWALTGGPKYIVEGATEKKYIDNIIAKAAPNKDNWVIPSDIDVDTFDFSWHPYAEDEPFVYQFGTQWQKTGGPKYIAPGADETSFIKYIDTRIIKAKKLPNRTNWIVPDNVDENSIDFSWHPDETEPAYVYKFGTQWHDRGGPEYHVPGASSFKYSTDITSKTKPNRDGWKINIAIEEDKFDFSWVPHPDDPAYIYVFGNQWNGPELESTIEYIVDGATEKKYMHNLTATVSMYKDGWKTLGDVAKFDYSWRPNPTDPAYIYVFGNKQYSGTIMPTVELHIEGATEKKYVEDVVATLAQRPELFTDTELVNEFDYSWRPNPKDPPYIYQFGTQWAKTHGPKYIVEGATEVKYVDEIIAIINPDMTNWEIPNNVNVSTFDFSWHPDANSPKYIYQFGTIEDPNDGPRYVTPGNTGEVVNIERVETMGHKVYPKYYITTTLEDLINEHPNEIFWALREDIDYTSFDFSWKPDIQQANYLHAFGSSESVSTQTYFVNAGMYLKGFKDINYVDNQTLDEEALAKLFKKPDMFFVDRGNTESQQRYEQLKSKFPTIQKTRFLNTWVDTINRCINRSTTNLCWILNSELDYSRFDFNYYPNPWQMKMVHVFGTQWSHWGTTFMVNRDTFAEDTKYVKIIEHLSNLNFVKQRRAHATNRLYDVYVVDHGNGVDPTLIDGLNAKVVPYNTSYFDTFKDLLKQLPEKKEHYVWICSSVCDYQGFDFTYICDPFAREQLHVFPSDKQKFGDTFLINVNKLRELVVDMTKLEDYNKINYNGHLKVKRLPAPIFTTKEDTHVSIIHTDYNWPYATFQTSDNEEINSIDIEPMSLWSPEHKNIIVTSVGGTRIIAPKEIKDHVKRELYDYPYIITNSKLAQSNPLDIVFLSNGEKCADENYEHLLNVTKGLRNRITRVDGVNGRVQAYHAAAEASNTPWMFTVFAKLKVSNKFDWNWQPDRLQIPKHYVFHAKNPVNNLVYGHQAMIAYNKKLTLDNDGKGLDFTMDDEHEIVELLSGVANFNTDEYSTWRTSFREALKLKDTVVNNPDDAPSIERLLAWSTIGNGDFGEHSVNGALDAIEYYDSVNGDFDKLKLSYEWKWLREFYERKYK